MADLSRDRRAPLLPTSPALQPLPAATRHILRGGPQIRLAAEQALRLALPASACRAVAAHDRAALWLGPDEWLLISPEGSDDAAALGAALGEHPHSLVDVSHRQLGIELRGAHAATLLAAGCALDLDLNAFPVGMCTRTMLGKAEIILWRTAPEVFRIEVWRSFATYVAAFLEEAARGIA
ncbi:MAG TPA: sarcosine oxidase subunit gamma family protein [Steroidobacteraceae bacterium]|nr:sarcosine oxidase subunit gamma family protein [Steroidobacteraceae bacterium]